MSHTRICNSTQRRTISKVQIGSCCALVVAVACCAAVGEERPEVETAFLDENYAVLQPRTEFEPPSPPDADLPTPRLIEGDSYYPDERLKEEIAKSDTSSPNASGDEPDVEQYYEHTGIWSLPWLNRLHHRWITTTKPALQASYWGYPEYFEERPFGSYVVQAEQMQMVNGLQDQQVLYHYDFYPGDRSTTLSPRGEYQLRKIIQRMEIAPSPIIVQTSIVNPDLDEARRQHILDALRAAGVPAEPELVVVDHPPLPGLQGLEGELVYGNMLGQTQARGGGFQYGVGSRPTAIFIGGGIGVTQPAP